MHKYEKKKQKMCTKCAEYASVYVIIVMIYFAFHILYTLPTLLMVQPEHTQSFMLVRKSSPFLYQNYPCFGFFFLFFCPQVRVESVSERANPTLLLKTPFWIHFLNPFFIQVLPPFFIPFLPPFSYHS